jgi:hypothetical protein
MTYQGIGAIPFTAYIECGSSAYYWECIKSKDTNPPGVQGGPSPARTPTELDDDETFEFGTTRQSGKTKYDPYLIWVDDGWDMRSRMVRTQIVGFASDQVDARGAVYVIEPGSIGNADWVSEYTAQGCAVLVDYRHEYVGAGARTFQVMVTRDPYVIAKHARNNFAILASYGPLYREAAALARAGFDGLGATQQTVTIPLPAWPSWLPVVPLPSQVYEWLTRVIPGAEIPTKKELAAAKAKSETGSWVAPVVGAVVGASLLGILWLVARQNRS